MFSLLINKKHITIFCFIVQFIMTSYTNAEVEAGFESISIEKRHEDNIYYPGDSFNTSCYIKNNGDEDISYHLFVFRIYAGDYHIGSFSVPAIKAGEVGLSHVPCFLPNDIPYDTYTISGKIFLEDSNLDNNIASDSTDIIIQGKPTPPPVVDLDLDLVDAERPSNNTFYKGFTIKAGCRLYNRGNVTSESYDAKFYIGEYFIGSVTKSPIEAGQSDYVSEAFMVPLDISVGYQSLICEIECPNDVDLSNNRLVSWKKVIIATPNPEISMINLESAGDIFRQGDYIFITTTIQSSGYLDATDICIQYYANEYLIGSTTRDDLEPGNTDQFSVRLQLPDELPDGYYSITGVVTCTNDKEMDNNYGSSGTFWVGRRFDLEVKTVQAINGTYMPKETIDIYSLIENVGDKVSNKYTIDFYMSEDKDITLRDYRIGHIERAALEPGEQHSYNTTFKLPPNLPASNYYVGVIVRSNGEDEMGNNSGYDNENVEIIHPANYVCGHITYVYPEQNDQNVRYALLKILDSGTNRVIAQTYTDENGNYGEVVLRDSASSNIFIQVYTEGVNGAYPGTKSKICSVKDDVYHLLFSQKSSSYNHPTDSSREINLRIPVSGRSFMVFDSMVEAFIQAKEYFGIEMEPITVCWPSPDNGTYYYPEEGIFISIDDEWDRDIILHEYGHYIAEVYNFCQGSVGENPMHTWDEDLREFPVERIEEHAANLAFRESWPTLFSIASQYYDYTFPHSGDSKYQDYNHYYNISYELDLERDTFDKGSPGEYYENMNCCSLWDIFDSNPDNFSFNEEISDPNLTKIWNVIRSYQPEDMNDFWVGWFHLYGQNDDKDGIIDIFQEHQMDFAKSGDLPVLPQNHAPVARAGQDITVAQDREEGAEVHLDASGSYDSDGDTITYIWRYGYIPYSGPEFDIVLPVGKNELEVEVTDGKITKWDIITVTVTPIQ